MIKLQDCRFSTDAQTFGAVNRPVGVDGPRRHRMCQNEVVADLTERGPSMEQISRIGMDTSKRFFQLHGVNTAETVVLRKKLRRKEMVTFFEKLAPTVVGSKPAALPTIGRVSCSHSAIQ